MKSSKKIYQVMSLLIAISLWVYVVAEENIFQERTITVDVQFVNLEETLIPSSKIPTVNISVRGDQTAVNNLKVSDFSVVADLSIAEKGENEYPVKVEVPPGVRLVSVSPENIFVDIDDKGEKQVPLKVNLSGTPIEGFTAFEPSLQSTHISVSGPEQVLEEITFAEIDVNIDNAESNLSLKVIPRIKGISEDFDVDILEIKPELVDVFIPVIEDNPSKSVPVVVPITGLPAYGYKISRVVVEPEIVRISGAVEVLDNIREIRTTPVDVTNHNSEMLREVNLNIPGNIKSLHQGNLKVVVLFEKNIVEKRVQKSIEVKYAPNGKVLVPSNEIVAIVLKGEELEFRDFLLEDLVVYVDASNYTNSTQEFEVIVEKPANIEVVDIIPEKVTLKEGNKNTEEN